MKPIPISAAQRIAEAYGYDQVIIIARKVGEGGGEHCTTYGVDKANCSVAARCGDFLKHKVMGWHREQVDSDETKLRTALRRIVELGERHVDEARMRRLRDFREAISIAVDALGLTPAPARKDLQHPDAGPRGDRYPFGDPQ